MSYMKDPFLPSFLQLFTISQEVPEVERGKRRRRRRLSSVSTSSGKFALTLLRLFNLLLSLVAAAPRRTVFCASIERRVVGLEKPEMRQGGDFGHEKVT